MQLPMVASDPPALPASRISKFAKFSRLFCELKVLKVKAQRVEQWRCTCRFSPFRRSRTRAQT
jgi:hypothetical protein